MNDLPRIDGAPIDALPEAWDSEPTQPAVHQPSYVSGWRWGLLDGVFIGGLLTAAAFLIGFGVVP